MAGGEGRIIMSRNCLEHVGGWSLRLKSVGKYTTSSFVRKHDQCAIDEHSKVVISPRLAVLVLFLTMWFVIKTCIVDIWKRHLTHIAPFVHNRNSCEWLRENLFHTHLATADVSDVRIVTSFPTIKILSVLTTVMNAHNLSAFYLHIICHTSRF